MDISILGLLKIRATLLGRSRCDAQGRLCTTAPAIALTIWMAVLPFGTSAAARGISEQNPQTLSVAQIKAAFLLNFARFAEWSPGALPDGSPVLIFCFDGAEDVRIAFEALTEGKEVLRRKVVSRRIISPANAQACHAVFANDSKHSREVELLKSARDVGALTVGDGMDLLACGGMIQLVLDDNRMRFDINLSAVSRGRIKLSSKLLALARHIVELPAEAAN